MEVTTSALLEKLPPYQDQWILIKENQEVKDIKKRIEVAHKKYAEYYDCIALYFDADTIEEICNNICKFIQKNIEYREEPNEKQTTSLVTGILYRGYGDCKHYALFAAGILNAIERLTGKKIDWVYRFASYNINPTPHHVFVVVFDKGDEIWIDPVPGSDKLTPLWMQDKKVNVSSMALYENIAGVMPQQVNGAIGTNSVPVYPVKTHDLNFDNIYPGFTDVWKSHGSPVLTLNPGYGGNCDAFNGYNIQNLPQLTDLINAEIAHGPEPHTVTADTVDWIWKSNVRSWNFYYSQGVAPDALQIADERLPASWPRPIVTPDGRLTFDKLANIGECHNPYIHLLTGAIQQLLNQYLGDHSYIISPNQPVEYMNYGHPGEFNKINMFSQIRGDNIFEAVLKIIKSVYISYAKLQMKMMMAVPRNAFLGMLALNLFKWAKHLEEHIAGGEWQKISHIWEGLGGNPTRLLQAIEKGAKLPAIDEHGNHISGTIGEPVTATAVITAAVPIIALMLKYLDKTGKASEIVAAAEPALALQFPDIDWSGLKNGLPAIDRATGQPVQFIATDPDTSTGGDLMSTAKENPLPVAAVVGLGTHFLFNKKGKKPNYVIPVIAAGATYFFLSQSSHNTQPVLLPGDANQVTAILNWVNGTNESAASKEVLTTAFKSMPADDIATCYDFIFNYFLKGKQVEPDSLLYNRIMAISERYNIFT